MITKDRLAELFSYDPETGHFTRKVNSGPAKAGEIAGYKNSLGYVQIYVDGRRQYAHRLAWMFTYGEMPSGVIDHANGDRSDNRICNLRDATQGQNVQNRSGPKKRSKSGFLGVAWDRCRKRWLARIQVDGKPIHIGHFKSAEDAHSAYLAEKAKHHPFWAGSANDP